MTTAARPTFDPAKGGSGVREKSLGKLSQQVSARDQRAHLTLKERVPGQDTIDEVNQRDLKAELEEREKIASIEKAKGNHFKYVPSLEQTTQVKLALKLERDKEREAQKYALLEADSIEFSPTNKVHLINARKMAQLDADDDFGSINSDSDFDDEDNEANSDDEDLSDEDDPAELMAELEKIKQERALEEKLREQEKQKKKEEQLKSANTGSSFAIKRRWDDDVPFKNCARAEPEKKKLYINDTLRQEFHRKFMDKYIG